MARQRWSAEDEAFLRWAYPDGDVADLARLMSRSVQAIRARAKLLKIQRGGGRQFFTNEEDEVLIRRYPHERTDDIARDMERDVPSVYARANRLGLKKTEAFLKSTLSGRTQKGMGLLSERSKATRFKKGHVPPNKGVKGWQAGGRSEETRFRKGQVPHNDLPVGTEIVRSGGYLKRKVRDDLFPRYKNWKFVHLLLWEETHGPVPPGHVVVFKDGDKTNVVIDNLEMITRKELAARNTIHNLPDDLKKTIRTVGSLNRTIRRLQRQKEEQ